MSNPKIRASQEGLASTLRGDPEAAFSTGQVEASISDGLACRVTDGTNVAHVDMPLGFGGTATGPSPGFHARGAVASCTAIGMKSAAARTGGGLEELTVRIVMDFEDSAIFGMGNNTAAPISTKLLIRVKSESSDTTLTALVTETLGTDPYFLALREPQKVTSEIERI